MLITAARWTSCRRRDCSKQNALTGGHSKRKQSYNEESPLEDTMPWIVRTLGCNPAAHRLKSKINTSYSERDLHLPPAQSYSHINSHLRTDIASCTPIHEPPTWPFIEGQNHKNLDFILHQFFLLQKFSKTFDCLESYAMMTQKSSNQIWTNHHSS